MDIGYNFEVRGQLLKEHDCPICLMLIRNATELPCSHLMCGNCILRCEENELKKNRNGNFFFLCSVCKEVYHRTQKKEVKSVDRMITESIDVKCKQWTDGCVWHGCISNYENHHVKVCEFLLVECKNIGCDEKIQRKEMKKHKEFCKHSIVSCEHCEGVLLRHQLENHHETCQLDPVACQNSSCEERVQRVNMEKHRNEECQHQIVDCVYHVLGCDVQVPRHALKEHLQDEYHSSLLLESNLYLQEHYEDIARQQTISIKNLADEMKRQHETFVETDLEREIEMDRLSQSVENLEEKVKKQPQDTALIVSHNTLRERQTPSASNAEINLLKNELRKQQEITLQVRKQYELIIKNIENGKLKNIEMRKKIARLEWCFQNIAWFIEMINYMSTYKSEFFAATKLIVIISCFCMLLSFVSYLFL